MDSSSPVNAHLSFASSSTHFPNCYSLYHVPGVTLMASPCVIAHAPVHNRKTSFWRVPTPLRGRGRVSNGTLVLSLLRCWPACHGGRPSKLQFLKGRVRKRKALGGKKNRPKGPPSNIQHTHTYTQSFPNVSRAVGFIYLLLIYGLILCSVTFAKRGGERRSVSLSLSSPPPPLDNTVHIYQPQPTRPPPWSSVATIFSQRQQNKIILFLLRPSHHRIHAAKSFNNYYHRGMKQKKSIKYMRWKLKCTFLSIGRTKNLFSL